MDTKTKVVPYGGVCPYDASVRWRIHNNYFQNKGGDAWRGDVPFHITCNEAAARQNAAIVHEAVRRMEEEGIIGTGEPINVLEIASGLGLFAANFIASMRQFDEERGTVFAPRLHYLFTDYSEKNLRDAAKNAHLSALHDEGILGFYVLDALEPGMIRSLDTEESLSTPSCCAVIANYLHCVLPLSILLKSGGVWQEKLVQANLPVPEDVTDVASYLDALIENPTDREIINHLQEEVFWRDIEQDFFSSILHREVVEAATASYETATVIYPYGSLQSIERTLGFLLPGGVILISDKGHASAQSMDGKRECAPSLHGNCFAHSFNFPLVEAFARKLGLGAIRTNDPDASIHTLLIEQRGEPTLHDTFREWFIEENPNVEANDDHAAATHYQEQKDFPRALRFFRRVLRERPGDARTLFSLGKCELDAGETENALRTFQTGREHDHFAVYDFAFEIGRALHQMGKYDEAIALYQQSKDSFGAHSATWFNIGLCRKALGDMEGARSAFHGSLALDPSYEKSLKQLQEMDGK